ncbi:MAG: hypothetical protein V9G04_17305 [Nocardioides sp.]
MTASVVAVFLAGHQHDPLTGVAEAERAVVVQAGPGPGRRPAVDRAGLLGTAARRPRGGLRRGRGR